MSRFADRLRVAAARVAARVRRRPRRAAVLLALALAVVWLPFLLPGRTRAKVATPLPVKKADLVLTVEVEGELVAVRSMEIGVPPVAEVDFKIAFLAPEGAPVKKGDSILRFDTEMLERQLAQKRAELDEAQKKVEQKELDLRMKGLDLEQQTAQAKADLVKAQLKADVPAVIAAPIDVKKAELDKSGRERDLENLAAERRVTDAIGGAELRSLRQQRDRAAGRVGALEAAIGKMNVRAPQDGIVVYRTNWRDEKKKVGDSVWFGEVVLALPDLAEMKGDGFVDEADGGPVRPGQPVTLRLEARPDFDLRGTVARIGRTVRQRSWRTPLKGFRVEVVTREDGPHLHAPGHALPRRGRDRAHPGPPARPARGGVPPRRRAGRLGRAAAGLARGESEARPAQPLAGRGARGPARGRPREPGRPARRGSERIRGGGVVTLRWRGVPRGRAALAALGAVALVLFAGARLVRSLEPDPVATFGVEPGPFVREVEARAR